MKINWNKKYTTYAIYASLILAAVIFCIFCGIYITEIWGGVLFVFDVFASLFYGCAIAYLLSPLLKFFERTILAKLKRGVVRRGIGIALTYLVFVVVLGLLIYAVAPQLVRSFNDLQSNLVKYSDSLTKWFDDMANKGGIMGAIANQIEQSIDLDLISAPISYIIESLYELLKKFSPYIMDFISAIMVQVKNIVIGLVFSGYILSSKELIFAQINKLMHVFMKAERVEKIKKTVRTADKTFGQYIVGALVDAVVVGVLTAIAMLIFRIPYVPLISVLVACTNVIPIFGPFIGAIPSFIFIFIANPLKAVIFVVIILVIQQIDGNFIAPKILGGSTGLPAIAVITAITVMGGLFGMIGMVIAVPVFAVLGQLISAKTHEKYMARKAKASEGYEIDFEEPDFESINGAEVKTKKRKFGKRKTVKTDTEINNETEEKTEEKEKAEETENKEEIKSEGDGKNNGGEKE